MERQFFTEQMLLNRLKINKNDVSFIFGSALSAIKDGAGIPNVAQVSEIIRSYVEELDLLDEYNQFIKDADEQNIYQESFSFVSALMGAPAVQEIVKRVVMTNYDHGTGKHKIPKAIIDFVRSIKEGKLKVRNIITTNFDTLLEDQFDNEKIKFNSISIVSDSNIIENNNGYINIIHIHGVWKKGDTMHTRNQLESKRDRIEASLRHVLTEQHVIIMAYSGWTDSFTRTLSSIVNDDKAEYNLAWCFYEKEEGVIDRNFQSLFENLAPAISRDRIQFFNNVDCNKVFEELLIEQKKTKKTNNPLVNSVHGEINYFILDENDFCKHIRAEHRRKSIKILNERHALFIEAGLGFGLYGFVSSLVNTIENRKTKCIKIDLSDVISKNQIDDKVKDDTGHNLASLIYTLGLNRDSVYFIIFDKIRGNADVEAILYLLNLPDIFSIINENIFLIYSSSVNIKLFNDIQIKLKELDLHETEIVLRNEYGLSRFTNDEISKIHEQSEGVVKKLEQIMYFLESSSVQEVISQEDIFDDVFHSECIPGITQKQIDLLVSDPSKELTFRMLKILSILKNGETLSNLKKDKMGLKLGPRNTKDLIQFELATTIHIDSATTLIRVNPIIKDYVLSKMSRDEKFKIADAYLRVTITETKEGIKFSSSNRKIYDNGYNTEEDNSNTLLKLSIEECKSNINSEDLSTEDSEMNSRKLNKLLYLSRSYVYLLCNSSRFNEAISAISNLIPTIQDVDSENIYKYYHRIAYAHRMKSNHDEATKFLELCEDLCPDSDKETLESIYTEKLYLLKNKDINNAASFARNNKNKFHKNSVPYILSDVAISLTKEKGELIKALESQEKKARKLNFHTLANNILFILNDEKNDAEKINDLNQVIRTDSSAYNICRAIIYKNEVLVRNDRFEKIKDSDINNLINIYNYLFRQKFDNLFNECHSILWSIAEHKKNNELIVFIFYKGTIVWKLNSDIESETKYNTLISNVTNQDNIPLLGNFYCP